MPRLVCRWSVAPVVFATAMPALADPLGPMPLVEVSAEVERMKTELGFEVKGVELTEGASAHAGGGSPVGRLHLLLEDFDHIIVQGPGGGIQRLIILGEKSDYVPPPLVIEENSAEDAASGGDADIVLSTHRQGASHVVTLGLEGPNNKRMDETMLIDTGADRIVLPISLLSALGLGATGLQQQQVQTANGEVEARIGKLNAIWLGDQRVEDVEVAFLDDSKLGGTSLLGMSLLGRFRMTIDDEKNQLTLARK